MVLIWIIFSDNIKKIKRGTLTFIYFYKGGIIFIIEQKLEEQLIDKENEIVIASEISDRYSHHHYRPVRNDWNKKNLL